MSLHLLRPMIKGSGRGRKKTVRKKAPRRRAKKTEEGDKYLLWGRRQSGLTDHFTLAVYIQFLIVADTVGIHAAQTCGEHVLMYVDTTTDGMFYLHRCTLLRCVRPTTDRDSGAPATRGLFLRVIDDSTGGGAGRRTDRLSDGIGALQMP